ncbi:uncharacterized protein B0I36DRAFT_97279 [Microdochium trichocladiopsis]|uniref:Mid2 domain-containing protein n=1 Tax=Microdochium trichocladiopsis TaxID=1682393 RepID=A0A9P8YC99_9PEZI|nr:uncharacterized protein B0I36DRAFT_97279 [Microdochium trichocladiopsis]KAH7035843.1 hypothetical protein B0I36DRAFT_97279 [Microdochium trichocladiopsis]
MVSTRTISTIGLAVATAVFAPQVDAQEDFLSRFTFPGPEYLGKTFHYLDTLEVAWISNYTAPTLWLFCRKKDDDTIFTHYRELAPGGNATREVTLQFKDMDHCWLNLRSEGEKWGINGVGWQFDNSARGQTTIGLGSSSSTSSAAVPSQTSSSQTPSVTATSPTGSSAPPPPSSPTGIPDDSLSTGAKAGIGAGAAAAGLIIIAALIFFFMRRRKNNNNKRPPAELASQEGGTYQDHPQYPPVYGGQAMQNNSQYQQLGTPGAGAGGGTWVPAEYYTKSAAEPQEMYTGEVQGAHEIYTPHTAPTELPSGGHYR